MKSFSAKAAKYPTEKFVLIIDEINRGNLAKIFGELIHCLEYRGVDGSVILPYSQDMFSIPENVYIIGTMNSAGRSIALVDFALRRRFNFIEFFPQLDLLKKWLDEHSAEVASDKIMELLKAINTKISEDDKLGEYFQIGHSHFMRNELNKVKLSDIWNHSVLPLLKEYYFEEKDEMENFQKIYAETIGS
jgi:5-methylcytosine-specific restriction protein B